MGRVADACMGLFEELAPDLMQKIREAEDGVYQDALSRITAVIDQLPSDAHREIVLKKFRRLLHKERVRLNREIRANKEERERVVGHIKSGVEHLDTLMEWSHGDQRLQRPKGSMVADFCTALDEGRIYDLPHKDVRTPPDQIEAWKEIAASASVFAVQHDWAAAFRNARDYLGGEIRLPDDACAFEFRINDRHVIAFATDADGALYQQITVQVRKGWVLFPVEGRPEFGRFSATIREQIRAVAVALDAQVATAETVRAPHRSNRPPAERVPLPMLSYHVVMLNRRPRADPLPRTERDGNVRHVRLHFRRGHWRHYPSHKTWINWLLAGDPDLGFVDKEYRL